MSAKQITAAHFVREIQSKITRSESAIRCDIAGDGFAHGLVSGKIGKTIYLHPNAVDRYFEMIANGVEQREEG